MTSDEGALPSREAVPDAIKLTAQEWERLASAVAIKARCDLQRPDLVGDIVQETLIRAHKALVDGRLQDLSRLGAFVAGIAHYVIVDVIRDEGRARLTPLDFDSVVSSIPSTAQDPLETVIANEDRGELRVALRGLSESDRELVRLVYFEGLRPHEIALGRDEPAERVRQQLSRALGRLRTIFLQAAPRRSRSDVHTDNEGSLTGRPESQSGSEK